MKIILDVATKSRLETLESNDKSSTVSFVYEILNEIENLIQKATKNGKDFSIFNFNNFANKVKYVDTGYAFRIISDTLEKNGYNLLFCKDSFAGDFPLMRIE